MRTNLPVSNVEYQLKDGASIVSKADLRGVITFVNADFVEAVGFPETELIGQRRGLCPDQLAVHKECSQQDDSLNDEIAVRTSCIKPSPDQACEWAVHGIIPAVRVEFVLYL